MRLDIASLVEPCIHMYECSYIVQVSKCYYSLWSKLEVAVMRHCMPVPA